MVSEHTDKRFKDREDQAGRDLALRFVFRTDAERKYMRDTEWLRLEVAKLLRDWKPTRRKAR